MEFKPLNIYIIDTQKKDTFLESLFPTLIDKKTNFIQREFKQKDFHWKVTIYESLEFLRDIHDSLQKNNSRNNIILYFSSKFEEIIKQFIKICDKIFRPFLIFVSKNNHPNLELFDNRLLTFILENGEEAIIKSKISSVLWEKDCYFNERGNASCSFTLANLLLNKFNTSSVCLNFFLTGDSRAGKSTLINFLAKKYIALESCDLESVTTKINEYIIESKFPEFNGSIRFYDTPGLIIKNKKIENEKIVISQMKQIFKNTEDSKDDIHFIYFFIKPKGNLENSINLLKYLLTVKKKYNIPILFIINGDLNTTDAGAHDISISALKKFLSKYYLEELYNGKLDNKEIDEFEALLKSDDAVSIDQNLIKANLKSIKDNHNNIIPISGIDEILKFTLENLKKNNPLNEKYFEDLLKNKDDYEQYKKLDKKGENVKEKMEKNRIEAKKLRKKISEENSLFKKLNDLNAISENTRNNSNKIISLCKLSTLATGFIPLPMVDISSTLFIQTGMIISIGLVYGYSAGEIPINNLFQFLMGSGVNIAGDAFEIGAKNALQFGGKKIVEETTKVSVEIAKKTTQKVIEEITTILLKYSSNSAAKLLAEGSKIIPVIGSILGGLVSGGINFYTTKKMGEKCIEYFESLLKNSGGANFYNTRKNIYKNLFIFIEKMDNKENFEVQII